MRNYILVCIACVLGLPPLAAEERYLVVLFGSTSPDGAARRSHTFATFMKMDIGEPDEDGEIPTEATEMVTISWLPVAGRVRILARPEQGRNYDLRETLEWSEENGMETTVCGPFEISREMYDRAVERKAWLDSGRVAYKVLDRRSRGGAAVNCIHAVSDLIPGPLLNTGTARGPSATAMVTEHFRPHLKDPDRVHTWAMEHLDTNGQRLVVRNDSRTYTVSAPAFTE